MKFGPEDGIITAFEASERSSNGFEDSLDREVIRDFMKQIRHVSFYGQRSCMSIGKMHPLSDVVRSELVRMGYSIDEKEYRFNQDSKVQYNVIVSW